jgi:hypothetical protein
VPPSGVPTKMLNASLFSPMHVKCPEIITLDMIVSSHIRGEEHQSRSSSLSNPVKVKNTYIIKKSGVLLLE